MKVVVVGATGTIARPVVRALQPRHEVVAASRSSGVRVDIREKPSLEKLFQTVKDIDAVVCCAGSGAWKPLEDLTDAVAALQADGPGDLARLTARHLRDGGSSTLTSGVLSREPVKNGAAISLVNAGLEGFAVGASIELPRGLRINVVSPPWIAETLSEMKMDPKAGVQLRQARPLRPHRAVRPLRGARGGPQERSPSLRRGALRFEGGLHGEGKEAVEDQVQEGLLLPDDAATILQQEQARDIVLP